MVVVVWIVVVLLLLGLGITGWLIVCSPTWADVEEER